MKHLISLIALTPALALANPPATPTSAEGWVAKMANPTQNVPAQPAPGKY